MSHVPGDRMIKAVVVRVGEDYALAVCPATYRVDVDRLAEMTGKRVQLANEGQMEELFIDAELGAEAPIGKMYNLATYVDKSVCANDAVVFQAGTHMDTIEVPYRDFARAAEPKVGEFAEHI